MGQGEGTKGPASHAILTYIVWGYSFLGADTKWFKQPKSIGALVAWVVLAVLLYIYTYMAYITTKYAVCAWRFVVAVLPLSAILGNDHHRQGERLVVLCADTS